MKSLLCKRKLKFLIEIKRKVMYTKVKRLGLRHPEVVKCSKELDVLLNKYQP
jgi:stage 0 sporulation regulatory protein